MNEGFREAEARGKKVVIEKVDTGWRPEWTTVVGRKP